MNAKNKTHTNMKQKVMHEVRIFIIYTLFLFILFSIFNVYERLLMGIYGDTQIRYGYSLIEALILAKIIMLGQAVKIGERFKHKPLIFPVVHKTVIFSLLLLIFNICEHYIMGFFAGNTIEQTYHEVMRQKINIMLAKNFIMIIIFAQFFTMLELSKTLGENRLVELFFKRRRQQD